MNQSSIKAHVSELGTVTVPSMGSCLAFHDDDDDDRDEIPQTYRLSLIYILITCLCQNIAFIIHTLEGFFFFLITNPLEDP